MLLNNQVNVDQINSYEFSNETMINMQNIKNSNSANQFKRIVIKESMMSILQNSEHVYSWRSEEVNACFFCVS